MAEAGLSTPLHLAASLLALFAAVGLAIVVVTRPGAAGAARRGALDLLLATGAMAIAVGHGLSGALVSGSVVAVAWLHAGGLALVAVGLSPRGLRRLAGPAVLLPVPAVPVAAAVAAAAGLLGGVRGLVGGRRTILVGVGLLAWGAAEPVERLSLTAGAALTVAGAAAIGWWLWQASARALLAKFVTASVAILLAVVVLIAGALSDQGSRDLVDDELDRLDGLSAGIATQIESDWLVDAINAAAILRGQGSSLLRNLADRGNESLEPVYEAFFRGQDQDFLVVLDEDGMVAGSYAPTGPLDDSFLLQLSGTTLVDRLLSSEANDAGELLTIGGQFVGVGAVALDAPGARAETPPLGVVLTGRIADATRVAATGDDVASNVILATGNASTVASPGVRDIATDVVAAVRDDGRDAVPIPGRPLYAAAAPIEDPGTGTVVGRVVAVSEAATLADLEQDQARRLFLLALVGALLAGAVAALVTRRLVAPIRRLTTAAAAVREGDLDVNADVASRDEVGVLGRTFDEMTTSLAAQSAQLRDAATVQSRLRARLEALTTSMSDALVAVDPDGKVATFNPAAERLVGRAVPEVVGLPLEQVLVGRGPGGVPAAAALGASDSEQVTAVQLLLERSDGRRVPTAASAAPVHDTTDGQFLGRVLVLRDVTRETEIERMKTEFLSNVSHELRTPLTPIKGYAEVLARRDVGPEETRKFAGQILSSTGRLERIVGMIVDFAALDSGRVQPRLEAVDLSSVVGEVLAQWRRRIPDRDFRRRVAKSLPAVLADRAMLQRCLDELIDNAVKFSPGGEPISVAATLEHADGKPMVRLSVRDRGVGIEPTTAARVFSDFYQGDASETRLYGGLGLGLALVRRIVDGLEGDVAVESRLGRGSTFHLLLPVADTVIRSNGSLVRERLPQQRAGA